MTKNTHQDAMTVKLHVKFFSFISPAMIITITLLGFLIIYQHERILASYHENIPLNSAIFLVIGFSIFKSFRNNFQLLTAIKWLKKVEDVEGTEVSKKDVEKFASGLSDEASWFEIQNMYNALENLTIYSHLNLSDTDARLIKSKFGNRVKSERLVVNYFAGLLIMMGLIGTFWGLLQTITAVGGVLGEVSSSMSAQTAAGGGGSVDMGSFISKISAPLQGMGIAFSASLFGIGGSLMLGFLNFFATHAQDKIIEMVSRWLDSRIPQLNPALNEKTANGKMPHANDLKSWLAGFVYLSTKTNHKMGQMILAMMKSTQVMQQNAAQSEKLYDAQKQSLQAIEAMGAQIAHLNQSCEHIAHNVSPILSVNETLGTTLYDIKNILVEQNALAAAHPAPIHDEQSNTALSSQLRELATGIGQFNNSQQALISEISRLGASTGNKSQEAEFSTLVWQLNTILEEIKQKNGDIYADVFETTEQ